jgi:RNA polymerase sigma-70 factor (ECF subfamily)
MALAPLRALPRRWQKRRWAWRHLLSSMRHGAPDDGASPGRAATAQTAEYEAFFWQFEHRIYGYLMRMVGDPEAARDLTQETFLRAWKEFDKIAPHRDNGRWLFRVASNLAINYHRHRSTVVGSPMPLDVDYLRMSDPNERFSQHEYILDMLRELTPKQRAVLVLHEVFDLTCDEIGQVLSMSRGATKMALFRAREHFAQIYQREESAL